MDLSFILDLTQKGNQKQQQMMTHAMQQSLTILELPVLELADYISQEVQDNFLLEFADASPAGEYDPGQRQHEEKVRAYQESLIRETLSLFHHLMNQAREVFDTKEELSIAEWLIGNIDEKGFYTSPLNGVGERRALSIIQTFDPPGIGAQNLRQSLLIQLKARGKGEGLSTTLLNDHYDALKKNNLISLLRKLSCSSSELKQAIKTISLLNVRPASSFREEYNPSISVDLTLDHDGEKWRIDLNDERIPKFRFAPHAFNNIGAIPPADKRVFRQHLSKGKWLFRALHKRENTIKRLAKLLIKKQGAYLLGDKRTREPLTMQEVARELSLNESTITRAVKDKHLSCPAGVFPLRSFFSSAMKNAKLLLQQLIQKENKKSPLSDDAIALKLQAQGLPIARRTITKYRKQLRIATASKRKSLL